MFAFTYDTLFSCDVLMFITLVTSYVPLFIIVFKNMEENMDESIRIEKNMLKKIQELQIENTELKAKIELLGQDKVTKDKATTTDEKEEEKEHVKTCDNCNNPTETDDDLLCHSCYHKSCNETGDECWCENNDPVLSIKKPLEESNNLINAFNEELKIEKI
jgi:hypothetical protein